MNPSDIQTTIDIPYEAIAQIAREYSIRKLSLFGSVLRDDFGPESDIDILVEFAPGLGLYRYPKSPEPAIWANRLSQYSRRPQPLLSLHMILNCIYIFD